MSGPQVRVGILADSLSQPAWVRHMLERILDEGHARFEVVVLNQDDGNEESTPTRGGLMGRLSSYWRSRSQILFLLFDRLDRRKFKTAPDAFEMVDISDLVGDVPTLSVSPRRTKFSDFIEGDDLERVKETGVDLFIRLGFRILRGGILEAAPAGVWSFHHGDNRVNRGGPAGYWEVFLGWPRSGAMLQILNEDLDAGLVLSRTSTATHPLSPNINRNRFYWQAAAMVPRQLRQLATKGLDSFLGMHRKNQPPVDPYSNRLFVLPTNREMVGIMRRWVGRYLRRGIASKFNREQWQLRFSFQNAAIGAPWRFKKVIPPNDRFWADPHLLIRDGKHYAFIEEKPNDSHGHVSVMEFRPDGTYTTPEPVLKEPFHLSYPFVFEHEDELYMIPESGDYGQVRLYRCAKFPDQWVLEHVIMDGLIAVDTTLFEQDGRWWLFAAIAEHAGASPPGELFLFWADSPLATSWTPHPANPIVSDVTTARPAGPLFRRGGRLIRPAQDCSPHYGYGIRLMEVTRLNEAEYEESEVGFLEPDWESDLVGTHSFTRAGRLSLIDVNVKRGRF